MRYHCFVTGNRYQQGPKSFPLYGYGNPKYNQVSATK